MAQSVGAVALDIVAGKNTLNSAIKGAMGEAESVANGSSGKISTALGKIGSVASAVGKTVAVGVGVASTAVVAMGKSAVSAYADYEQLVGGVETLFKDSAKTVIENASKAYTTAGMSANEYMSTVTSFSASLLQSLGGDTVKASEKADMAITDMSDNANKMGTSMEMIQNAYNGFAKQNYTMLDNLKLGYGGTKEEMQRLLVEAGKISGIKYDISSYADIVDAIHVVQTEIGITGTTAKEASSTISGSISSAKSAYQNLLAGIANENANIPELVGNVVSTGTTVLKNIIPVAKQVIQSLPAAISAISPEAGSAFQSIIDVIMGVLPVLKEALEATFKIVSDTINFVSNNIGLVASVAGIIGGITVAIGLYNTVSAIKTAMAAAEVTTVWGLVSAYWAQATAMAAALAPYLLVVAAIAAVVAAIVLCVKHWDKIKETVKSVAQAIGNYVGNMVDGIVGFFKSLWDGIKAVWDGICLVVKIAVGLIASILNAGFQIITLPFRFIWENCKEYVFSAWEWIKEKVTIAINAVKDVINTVMTAIKNFIAPIWNSIRDVIGAVVGAIKEKVSTAFNTVKNVTSSIFNSVKSTVSSIFNSIKTTISTVINSIKSTVTNVFNGVKDAMAKPIEKAKDAIKGIINTIKGFFSGMKLSFPNIKLPHFGISPKGWQIGDLLKGKIPRLGISWYAKAMNNPMIMTKPTIFGYDAGAGKLLGGGEAGSELVVGTNTLLNMIKSAVAGVLGGSKLTIDIPALQNVRAGGSGSDAGLGEKIDRLIDIIGQFMESGNSDMTLPIYIGNELIDEYILNKNNRNVLRSGGRA